MHCITFVPNYKVLPPVLMPNNIL